MRLEAQLHESLPYGPGRGAGIGLGDGNFLLTTLRAQLDLPTNPVEPRILKMARASADFSDGNANVTGAIDANDKTGWGIYPEVGKPHQAMFDLAEPVDLTVGTVLRVTLEFKSGVPQHQLGRFRLSTSEDPAVFARERHRLAANEAYAIPGPDWRQLIGVLATSRHSTNCSSVTRQRLLGSAICTPPNRIGSGRSSNTASSLPTYRPTATCYANSPRPTSRPAARARRFRTWRPHPPPIRRTRCSP